MPQFNNLVLTPIDGSDAVTLPHIGEISGPVNNVITFSFDEFVGDFQSLLAPVAAENVQHVRNRVGTYQAITAPAPKGLTVTFDEIHPFEGGAPVARSHKGVVSITGQSNSTSRNSFSLTLFICNYRHERATLLEESIL